MKRFNRLFLATLLSLVLSFGFLAIAAPVSVHAETTTDKIYGLLNKAGQTGFGQTTQNAPTPGALVGRIVTAILGFTGTIAFLVFLYGGFLWLTARGNEDQVSEAKKYLTNGTIGVVVIVLAYSAAYFITSVLYKAGR